MERSWGRPGGVLEASWAHLGAVLGSSWEPWGVLGASWGRLGAILGRLGPSWGPLGASWGVLGASWPFEAILEASWRHLGRALLRIFAPLPSETADSKAERVGAVAGAGGDRDGRWGEDKEGGRLLKRQGPDLARRKPRRHLEDAGGAADCKTLRDHRPPPRSGETFWFAFCSGCSGCSSCFDVVFWVAETSWERPGGWLGRLEAS